MNLSNLRIGQKAIVLEPEEGVSGKLFEMGCLPGEEIELLFVAPFRDPMCFRVQGTQISMRRSLAKRIPITRPHGS
jgi:ferrous iron transport protein A